MLSNRSRTILIVGDALAILAVSVIGYLMHYAGKEPFSLRWLSTFLPFCLGWALIAPWLGLYQAGTADRLGQVWWRAVLAAFLVSPLCRLAARIVAQCRHHPCVRHGAGRHVSPGHALVAGSLGRIHPAESQSWMRLPW